MAIHALNQVLLKCSRGPYVEAHRTLSALYNVRFTEATWYTHTSWRKQLLCLLDAILHNCELPVYTSYVLMDMRRYAQRKLDDQVAICLVMWLQSAEVPEGDALLQKCTVCRSVHGKSLAEWADG